MWRLAQSLGLIGGCAVLAAAGPGTHAAIQSRSIVGSYSLVTRITKPFRVQARGVLVIDTYNRSTGAITGHGADVSGSAPLAMTGSVHGSTIKMRVVNDAGVASDTGRIHSGGTIDGVIVAKIAGAYGGGVETGTWTMTPSIVTVGQVGLSVVHLGHVDTEVSYGIELRDSSASRDATNVTLDVRPLTKAGKLASGDAFVSPLLSPASVIPAGQTFYFGSHESLTGDVPVARLRVTVVAGAIPPKRRVLPPVSNIRIDHGRGTITATLTNPYSKPISPYDYTASLVVYDGNGRIIGGDDGPAISIGGLSSRDIKPGAQAPIKAFFPEDVPGSSIASARITIAPL